MSFRPRLDVLPPPQRALLPDLAKVPEHFALYGGTALALRLGHRVSVDFDFFSNQAFDPDRLPGAIPWLARAETVQLAENTLTARVDRGGPVLVSFFGGLRIGQVEAPETAEGLAFEVASLVDLAGTKVAVAQKRAQERDYIDVDALIGCGIDLSTALAAGIAIHGPGFNPLVALKALSYFGDLPGLSPGVQSRLSAAAKAVDLSRLPRLAPVREYRP
jgi:hypothetical protein